MVDWSMYAEIQRLKNKGFKKAQTAKQLGLNRETVTKYWDMPPDEYGGLTKKHRTRKGQPQASAADCIWMAATPTSEPMPKLEKRAGT